MSAARRANSLFGIELTSRRVFCVGIIIGVAYLSFAPPGSLVLDDTCEPRSVLNRWRATVQGSGFWRGQLVEVDRGIEQPARYHAAMAQGESLANMASFRSQAVMESVYRANPKLPRAESGIPAQLREQAKAIEMAEAQARVEQILTRHAMALYECRAVVEGKAHSN